MSFIPASLPQVTVIMKLGQRMRGHSVTLTEVGMHLFASMS